MGYLALKKKNQQHSITEYDCYNNEYIRPALYSKGEKGLYNLFLQENAEYSAWYVIYKEITSITIADDNLHVIIRIDDKVFILNKRNNERVTLARITDNVQMPAETYFI